MHRTKMGHATTQSRFPTNAIIAYRKCCIYSTQSFSLSLFLSQLSQLSRETLCRTKLANHYAAVDGPHSRAHTATHCFSTSISPPHASGPVRPPALKVAKPERTDMRFVLSSSLCAYRFGHTTSGSGTPYPHTCICTL